MIDTNALEALKFHLLVKLLFKQSIAKDRLYYCRIITRSIK